MVCVPFLKGLELTILKPIIVYKKASGGKIQSASLYSTADSLCMRCGQHSQHSELSYSHDIQNKILCLDKQ
jgi:hypothetical protein